MTIRPIKTDKDLRWALDRVNSLMNAEPETPEGNELEILIGLIENYENQKYNILPPDPISAIKFRMEQMGWSQCDLANIVGDNRASEILNGKLKLSKDLMRLIHARMNVPYESLFGNDNYKEENDNEDNNVIF